MKQRFTKLLAAVALLTFLAVPMGMWGQTRETTTGTLTMSDSQTSPVTINGVTFTWTSANIVTGGGNSSGFKANSNMTVTIPSGAILKKIEKTNGNNWGSGATISVYAGSDATGTIIASIVTGTHVYNISSNNTGTTYYFANSTTKNAWIKSLSITYEVSSGASTTVSIDATGITNTDVYTSTEAGSLSATVSANGEAITGATVAWSSSNENVATIDEDGVVTLVAAGTTTITAAYGGESGVYNPSSATYELAVTSSAPYVQPTTVEAGLNDAFFGTNYGGSAAGISDENPVSGTQDNVTITYAGGGNHYINATQIRFYPSNKLTFEAPTGYEITEIVFTAVSGGNWAATISANIGTYVSNTKTWTGSAASVLFTGSGSGRCDMLKATITLVSQGNAVATTTTINVPQDFNTDIYQGTNAGTLTATVMAGETQIDGAAVTWESSNTDVATIDANGAVTLVAVGTTTITASYAGVEDEYKPSTGTYELTVTDSNAPGTQNNPYTVAQALASSPCNGVFVHGIISTITEVSTSYGNATYRISDDGTTSSEMIVYRGKYLENAAFTSSEQIQVGDIVTVTGDLTEYNGANQLAQGNYLVSLEHPTNPIIIANDINLTYDATSGSIDYTISNPTSATLTASSDAEWISNIIVGSESVTFTTTANEGDTDRSASITLSYTGAADKVITVTQSHFVPDYATLPFVWEGGSSSEFLGLAGVTAHDLGTDYAPGNAPYLIKLDDTDDYIQVKTDSQPAVVTIGVKMIGGKNTSTITIQGSADGESFTDVEELTISGAQNDVLTLETTNAFAANVRYVRMLFTKGSNVGVGLIAICKSSLDINGHGGNAGNWYLIASPLTQNTAPTAINGLVAADEHYDLYRFNQNPTVTNNDYLEWENYKTHQDDFVLENGKGYLYASQESTTIYFDGACNNDDTKTVGLDYSTNNPDVNMLGWNLVGNPFTTVAYANHSYFVMDGNGTSIVAEPVSSSTAINPFTGVFVQATETGQSVIFSKTAPSTTNNKGVINLALSQQVNRGSAMVDKAVVSFNEGDQLGKFVFMESNAKLYIPKNGKDYAIAVAEGKGEMPVNFKAQENGTYTLNIDTENVEMNYLHLIDNMTGMDVDLLQTPSYTFDATTNDYASRFRLVFSANGMNENGETETFAFYSNGNWVVGNEGEATLQVIDVNGRIVSNETINGTVATSINATPGVYMLRLVNGNEVKTQKIVVK